MNVNKKHTKQPQFRPGIRQCAWKVYVCSVNVLGGM